ncbi:prolyl oligopeptidase family serine peptidase [Corallococcus sp. ZKHCc1 1396]|uniref:Prolyl oligopeptidase family serine peptidase n=1 Tax=Corallococcus soli TaxID=2710757 RepID=A0ABR9PZ24_9BACT|nr:MULTISPECIES: alpha/beta fold hydrolase [Corallococcus]MBE4753171.1 prolyl oligopeptidase family serine peptidase [Corallococcus soli]MCY1031672.1 prolyl oligopeptidase family serine peptidase [Corallococcus sp. BB11-1]
MKRGLITGLVLGGVALLALAAWVAVRSARYIASEVYPPRRPVERPPDDAVFAGLRDVAFQDRDGLQLKGWYLPPKNGALVILVHGLSGNRTQLLPEARFLAQAGYGLVLFDLAAHGESAGTVSTYGDREAGQVMAAVDFAARQPEVDTLRIGALGFSLGGYSVLKAAAGDPRLKAVVVEAAAVAPAQALQDELGHWGPLGLWPALTVMKRAGVDVNAVQPARDMAALGDRPVLLVAGTDDPWVPDAALDHLLGQAKGPWEKWRVPGTGHGDYLRAAPDEYPRRVLAFFSRFL